MQLSDYVDENRPGHAGSLALGSASLNLMRGGRETSLSEPDAVRNKAVQKSFEMFLFTVFHIKEKML